MEEMYMEEMYNMEMNMEEMDNSQWMKCTSACDAKDERYLLTIIKSINLYS